MTWPQDYRLTIFVEMGTFPKSGDDHNKPAVGEDYWSVLGITIWRRSRAWVTWPISCSTA